MHSSLKLSTRSGAKPILTFCGPRLVTGTNLTPSTAETAIPPCVCQQGKNDLASRTGYFYLTRSLFLSKGVKTIL